MRYSVFFIALLVGFNANSENIKLGTLNWAPFYAKDLPKQGIVSEIARAAFKAKGHDLKIIFQPWKRAVKQTEKGKFHGLLGCWSNPERQKKFKISNSMLDGGAHFLVPDNSTLQIKNEADLNGKKVAFVRGYGMSETLKEKINKDVTKRFLANKVKQLFGLLDKKKADMALENFLVAQEEFKKNYPGQEFKYKVAGNDFFNGNLYICFSRKIKNFEKINNDFNSGLDIIKKNGTFDKIKKEFGVK